MADTRKITIEILSDSYDNLNVENNKQSVENTIQKIMKPMAKEQTNVNAKTIILNQSYQHAKQLLSQSIELTLNRAFSLTEDYINQNNYQNIRKAYSLAASFGSSLIGGAMVGGAAGPGGAAIGAIISVSSWGANQVIQNKAALSSYYQDLNAANFNTDFSRTRAGLVNEGRGTDN